jgi:hypothetical protein
LFGEWKKLSRECDRGREKLDLEFTRKSETKPIAGEGKNKERRDAERERKEETRQGEGERKEEETRREEREREEEVKERDGERERERVERPGGNRTTPLKADHCQPENKRLASLIASQREREVPLSKTPSPHIVRTSDHSDLEKREVDKGEN